MALNLENKRRYYFHYFVRKKTKAKKGLLRWSHSYDQKMEKSRFYFISLVNSFDMTYREKLALLMCKIDHKGDLHFQPHYKGNVSHRGLNTALY